MYALSYAIKHRSCLQYKTTFIIYTFEINKSICGRYTTYSGINRESDFHNKRLIDMLGSDKLVKRTKPQ